jgi:hypothetical protein
VFITKAEPYSSTNWRFALSIVFGLMSPTTPATAFSLLQDVKVEQSPGDPEQSGYEPDEEGYPKGLPIERREVRPGDLMRLSPVLGNVRESFRHDFLSRV